MRLPPPRSAPSASRFPHLAGSFEAPRIATERGSKSARRSRLKIEEASRDDEALDVGRAFLDLLELGVPHPLLDRVLAE